MLTLDRPVLSAIAPDGETFLLAIDSVVDPLDSTELSVGIAK
jgi:hypothetical protein